MSLVLEAYHEDGSKVERLRCKTGNWLGHVVIHDKTHRELFVAQERGMLFAYVFRLALDDQIIDAAWVNAQCESNQYLYAVFRPGEEATIPKPQSLECAQSTQLVIRHAGDKIVPPHMHSDSHEHL